MSHDLPNDRSTDRAEGDRPLRPNPAEGMTAFRWQDSYFHRAQSSLRQSLNHYSQKLRTPRRNAQTVELQSALKTSLDQLSNTLDKLNHAVVRIAVFGLVSRGKSAVINALLGQKILQTGPINGVTQYPRSVYWPSERSGSPLNVELIDTPGLDEVGGESRATIAQEVAEQADLILFVIAGDITRTEYRALAMLQQLNKPIVLVFNKTDLYPQHDQQSIYQKLQTLLSGDRDGAGQPFSDPRWRAMLKPEDIVLVAAEPAPLEVRVEWPDGRVSYEWESPPAQIEGLMQKLQTLLNQEGKSLLALNALRQARDIEAAIARTMIKLHKSDAEDLIWQFARWKAVAIALNPIAVLDLLGGLAADLVMIRSLARLYGLPITNYEASKLLTTIIWSTGGLLIGEVGGGLLLGAGKSAAAITSVLDTPSGFLGYSTAAIAQASLAGYGSYRIGKAAQVYLEQGCSWGPQGVNTVMQDILKQLDPTMITHRLRYELENL